MLILVLAVRCQKQNFLNLHIVYGIIAIQPTSKRTIAPYRLPFYTPFKVVQCSCIKLPWKLWIKLFLLIISVKWVYLDRAQKRMWKPSVHISFALPFKWEQIDCFALREEKKNKKRVCQPFQCGYKFKKKRIPTTDFHLKFMSVSLFRRKQMVTWKCWMNKTRNETDT